tara:strand:- start:4102 stop:4293 length:192 start_codon:yes stop_codon:yes gene_type:complete
MSTRDPQLLMGTLGGTFASMLSLFVTDEVVQTILLAGLGASVSFMVSVLLKWLVRILKKLLNG